MAIRFFLCRCYALLFNAIARHFRAVRRHANAAHILALPLLFISMQLHANAWPSLALPLPSSSLLCRCRSDQSVAMPLHFSAVPLLFLAMPLRCPDIRAFPLPIEAHLLYALASHRLPLLRFAFAARFFALAFPGYAFADQGASALCPCHAFSSPICLSGAARSCLCSSKAALSVSPAMLGHAMPLRC